MPESVVIYIDIFYMHVSMNLIHRTYLEATFILLLIYNIALVYIRAFTQLGENCVVTQFKRIRRMQIFASQHADTTVLLAFARLASVRRMLHPRSRAVYAGSALKSHIAYPSHTCPREGTA